MSSSIKFDPQNRVCIAKGHEGCPACVASMHSVRETESFTIPKEALGPIEEAVLGICLISSSSIVVGGNCNVSDEEFKEFADGSSRSLTN